MEFSGDQLPFPAEPQISEACKDLLKKILVYDPSKRISWNEAFNHRLFDEAKLRQSNILSAVSFQISMHSLCYVDTNYKVDNEFEVNKQSNISVHELGEPEEINIDDIPFQNPPVEETHDSSIIEKNMELIKKSYDFLYNLDRFLFNGAKLLRELSKERLKFSVKDCDAVLLYCGLLTKKVKLISLMAKNSILKNKNLYNLQDFEIFTNDHNTHLILGKWNTKDANNQRMLVHVKNSIDKEVTDAWKDDKDKVIRLIRSDETEYEDLDEFLRIFLKGFYLCYVRVFIGEGDGMILDDVELKGKVEVGLSYMYLGLMAEVEMKFLQGDGRVFSWNEFNREFDSGEMKVELLKKISEL